MTGYKWRSKQRIVAEDDEVVVIEEIYPVGGPIEETPFCHVEEEPCNKP